MSEVSIPYQFGPALSPRQPHTGAFAKVDALLAQGFRFGHCGVHSGRTMMLADLALLIEHQRGNPDRNAYKTAVIEENILGKQTVSGRKEAFDRLSALYFLDHHKAMFRAMRWFWQQSPKTAPTLAFLTATARDPLLRSTAPSVLAMPLESTFDKSAIVAAVDAVEPGHFKPAALAKIAKNVGASWTQAGFLLGRTKKRRIRPPLTPAAVAYALYLGTLEGRSGDLLFDTQWVTLLDHPRHQIEEVAQEASARQLLDYSRAGSVREIGFRQLEKIRVQG